MNQAERLKEIMLACTYKDDEVDDKTIPPEVCVKVYGITTNFGLHPERLEAQKENILEIAREIVVDQFWKSRGGGWSFLNLCQNREGEQWTGFHSRMEVLFVLCKAIGRADYCAPREMWGSLPGGMPYMWFDLEEEDDQQ